MSTEPNVLRRLNSNPMTREALWDRRVDFATLGMYALICSFALIMYMRYSLGPFVALFNSDSAANTLYAVEMIRQHSLFPQWNDSTGLSSVFTAPGGLLELSESSRVRGSTAP